jgi:glycosyltransferase involved in cell wall biosynthesis
MSLPLISIIIPMYNQRPDFLRECLQSAINQTYSNIEIIVSDNHSTNEAGHVLEEFTDERLKIIKPPRHLDIGDNFSFAARAAMGEYISFLSSDDLLYPECIAKVVQPLIKNKDLVFAYCENAMIDEEGNRKAILRKLQMPSGVYPRKEIAVRQYIKPEYWIIGGVVRHEHFRRVGLINEMRAADWILGLQLLKYGNVAYCNEVLSAIRFHERKGDEKQKYAEAYTLHYLQIVTKHGPIIEDQELLDAIGISKEQAIAYRNKEILGSVITLTRKYHHHIVNKETMNRILTVYKKSMSGFSFNFLARFYASKPALLYTYLLGLYNRVYKKIVPGH